MAKRSEKKKTPFGLVCLFAIAASIIIIATASILRWHEKGHFPPFEEIFVQNTTYFTSYADAHYYTDPINYATTPIYMDRMEFIPAWVLAENDDDNDEDLLGGILGEVELPLNMPIIVSSTILIAVTRKFVGNNHFI